VLIGEADVPRILAHLAEADSAPARVPDRVGAVPSLDDGGDAAGEDLGSYGRS